MLKIFSLAALLSVAAVAQSPLTTTFANNNGGAAGGGVYFDLTNAAPITITGLDLNLAAGTGTVDIYTLPGQSRTGNQTNIALWTLAASGTYTSAGPGATTVTLSNSIPLGVGINGMAIRSSTGHAYTNGNGTNQQYSTAETTLDAGEASNVAFSGGLFTPRVVNCTISYSVGSGTVATATRYGVGGGGSFASTYENFSGPAAFDLNGANFQFTELASGGWSIGPGPGYNAPGAGAVPLPLTDDSEVTQAFSSGFAASVNVCSNGFVSVGGSNGTGFTPAVPTMLGNAFEAWYVWHDFNPGAAGSGQVKYEFVGGEDVVTWDGVFEFASTTANTFQMRFSGAPGARVVRCCFQSIGGSGNAVLVAYSPAGASVDPGNTDISATGSQTLGATDVLPLVLNGNPRPVIGTSAGLNTTNIQAGALAAVQLLSFTQNAAGLNLGVIGAPNNFFYLATIDLSVNLAISGGSATLSLPIPNNTSLVNGHLFAQTVTVVPGANPRGIVTSNGLDLKFGSI